MLGLVNTVYVFQIFLQLFTFLDFAHSNIIPHNGISEIDTNNLTNLPPATVIKNYTDYYYIVNGENSSNIYSTYNNEESKANDIQKYFSHGGRYRSRRNFTKQNYDLLSKVMMFKNKPLINLLHVPERVEKQQIIISEFPNDDIYSNEYMDNSNESWDKILDSFQNYDIVNDEVNNYTWIINYEKDLFQKSWSDIISNLRNSEVFKTSRTIMENLYGSIVPYVTVNMEEGRKMKLRRMLFRSLLGMKMLAMGVFLPAVVALATLQSWKAVTISLLALGLAAIVGIKNLIAGIVKSKSEPQQQHHHHIHSSPPAWHSSDSSWGRSGDSHVYGNKYHTISYWDRNNYRTPHEMAYSAYHQQK